MFVPPSSRMYATGLGMYARLPTWITLIAVILAHHTYTSEAADQEDSLITEECSERELTFTCIFPTDVLVVQSAYLYGVTAKVPDECKVAKHNLQYKKGSFLQYINKQCGGENECRFSVWNHIPAARSDEDHWKGGVLRVVYECMPKSDFLRTCDSDKHAQSGWLQSIGYPKYYLGEQPVCSLSIRVDEGQRIQLTISDISIRDMRDGEKTCTDSVVVREGEQELLHRCGESNKPLTVTSEGNLINVTLVTTSEITPKRGYVAYWKALGCESPVIPEAGFMSHRNATHAVFGCQSQHAFLDTLTKTRTLYCVYGRNWNDTLTDCADLNVLLENGNITESVYFKLVNDTHATALKFKQAHLVYDLVVPSIIMSLLVVGNVVVVLMIVYCRRGLRSSSSCSELESIKANPEPTDVIDDTSP